MPEESSSELSPNRLYRLKEARAQLNTFLKGRGRRIIPIKESALSDLTNITLREVRIDNLKAQGADQNDTL